MQPSSPAARFSPIVSLIIPYNYPLVFHRPSLPPPPAPGHGEPPRAPRGPPPPAPPHKALPQSRGLARGASGGAGTAIPPLLPPSLLAEPSGTNLRSPPPPREEPPAPVSASSPGLARLRLLLSARPPRRRRRAACARRDPREAGKGRAGRAAAAAPAASLMECGSPSCRRRCSPQPLLPVRRWFSSSRAAGGRRAGRRGAEEEGRGKARGCGTAAPPATHWSRRPSTPRRPTPSPSPPMRPRGGAAAPAPRRPMAAELMGARRRQREGSIKEILLSAGNRCVML